MATFTTHTEGGSWNGGGSDVPNCSLSQRTAINAALADIQTKLNSWGLPCLTGLRDSIQDMLNCSLEVDCDNDCDLNGYTYRGSGKITICPPTFADTQARINAVVFHEIVHAAGGTELDAEALENHFYTGNGATSPSSSDWDSFHDDGGEYVIWDEDSGDLFEKCVDSGSWDEGDTVTRGVELTPNFNEPDGGGDGGSWV